MPDERTDGGPAFPVDPQWLPPMSPTECATISNGMSLRDHFAGLAMQGMIDGTWPDDVDRQEISKRAWLLADAMLKARFA